MFHANRRCITTLVALLALGAPLAARADEEEKETGWFNTTELSYVLQSGNADTDTLGFNDVLRRLWKPARFQLKLEAIRATSRANDFCAGTDAINCVVTDGPRVTNAERYGVEARYDRKISERFYWNVGGAWTRNEPAGIQDRYLGFAGVGNVWWDREDLKFNTSYSVSYTDRQLVTPDPTLDETFGGFLFNWEYLNKFGKVTTYTNNFAFNVNLKETQDWTSVMTNAVAVAVNSHVALKVSLQWIYNNRPALQTIDIVPGPGTIDVRADELDTIFSTALVLNY